MFLFQFKNQETNPHSVQQSINNLSEVQKGLDQIMNSSLRHMGIEHLVESLNLLVDLFWAQAPSMMKKERAYLSYEIINGKPRLNVSEDFANMYGIFFNTITSDSKYMEGFTERMGKITKVMSYLKSKGLMPQNPGEMAKMGQEQFSGLIKKVQLVLEDRSVIAEINRQKIPNVQAFGEAMKGSICLTSLKAAACAANIESKEVKELTIKQKDNDWFAMSFSGLVRDDTLSTVMREAMLQQFMKTFGGDAAISEETAGQIKGIMENVFTYVSGLDEAEKQQVAKTILGDIVMAEIVVVGSKMTEAFLTYAGLKQLAPKEHKNHFFNPNDPTRFMQIDISSRKMKEDQTSQEEKANDVGKKFS